MLAIMQFINDYRALILPAFIIVELIAIVFLIRVLWQGFKEDFDL